MKETTAIIERIRRENIGYQRLELGVDEAILRAKPGQSLLVRVQERGYQPYLLEQWWPVNRIKDKLIVERPEREQYEPNQNVTILGPIGQPFRFRGTGSLRNVLLMAVDTPPTPLLFTIPYLLGNKISVTLVLLGSAVKYDTQSIQPEVEIELGRTPEEIAAAPVPPSTLPGMSVSQTLNAQATQPRASGISASSLTNGIDDKKFDPDLVWRNQMTTVGWADQVFVTVGAHDEHSRFARVLAHFRKLRHDVPKNYLFGVFQPMLPCGAGACHACMLKLTGHTVDTALICIEGPAFDLTQVALS